MDPIYLDFNSTAPLLPEVAAVMAQADAAGYANPASQHAAGRRARQVLEDAREEIAHLLGADLTARNADRLIFTSGGTEANNLALLGLTATPLDLLPFSREPKADRTHQTPDTSSRIIISSIEHPSITAAADFLTRRGWHIDRLNVSTDGVVQLDHFDQLLAAAPAAPRQHHARQQRDRRPTADHRNRPPLFANQSSYPRSYRRRAGRRQNSNPLPRTWCRRDDRRPA